LGDEIFIGQMNEKPSFSDVQRLHKLDTVDGRTPATHLGCIKPGYLPQLGVNRNVWKVFFDT